MFEGRHEAYPEVYLQVAGAAEFPVPHLECDSHFVIFVELLMEAFSRVRAEVDVVRCDEGEKEERH